MIRNSILGILSLLVLVSAVSCAATAKPEPEIPFVMATVIEEDVQEVISTDPVVPELPPVEEIPDELLELLVGEGIIAEAPEADDVTEENAGYGSDGEDLREEVVLPVPDEADLETPVMEQTWSEAEYGEYDNGLSDTEFPFPVIENETVFPDMEDEDEFLPITDGSEVSPEVPVEEEPVSEETVDISAKPDTKPETEKKGLPDYFYLGIAAAILTLFVIILSRIRAGRRSRDLTDSVGDDPLMQAILNGDVIDPDRLGKSHDDKGL